VGRVHRLDLDEGGRHQPFDVTHRGHEGVLLRPAERFQQRPRRLVAALVEQLPLREAGRRQAR
jgi:hypothetical protein